MAEETTFENALRELVEAEDGVEETKALLIGSINRWTAEDRKKAALAHARNLLAPPEPSPDGGDR